MRLTNYLNILALLVFAVPLPHAHAQLQQIAAAQQMYVYDIYTMNDDGTNRVRLTDGKSIVQQPAWSPDGKQIAYARDDGRGFDIWLMNADGSDNRRFTKDNQSNEIDPVWTPDGEHVAYVSKGSGLRDAMILRIAVFDSVESLMISASRPVLYPTISPASSEVIVTSLPTAADNNRVLTLSRANSDGLAALSVKTSAFLTQPAWAPNGLLIAARSSKFGYGEICVIDPATGAYTQLTDDLAEDRDPAWSPDGRSIVFASDRTGNFDLYEISADGGNVKNLTNTALVDEIEPVWRDRQIAFASVELGETELRPVGRPLVSTMPAGRYLGDRSTLLAMLTESFWRREHFVGQADLGKNGELIGIPREVPLRSGVLYCFRDENMLVIAHEGTSWRGTYAIIDSAGVVATSQLSLREKTPTIPQATYGPWPYFGVDRLPQPIPGNEVVFPSDPTDNGTLVWPVGALGWLIELLDGSFVRPKQSQKRTNQVIWVYGTGNSLELHRGTENQPLAKVLSDRQIIPQNHASGIPSPKLFWPYTNIADNPVLPPEGFPITPVTAREMRTIIRPDGRMEFPVLEGTP